MLPSSMVEADAPTLSREKVIRNARRKDIALFPKDVAVFIKSPFKMGIKKAPLVLSGAMPVIGLLG